jgi:hypothetical protein
LLSSDVLVKFSTTQARKAQSVTICYACTTNMAMQAAFAGPLCGICVVSRVSSCCRARPSLRMRASGDPSGVNISKYASQRSILSADKDINPDAINQLFVKAGKPVRANIIYQSLCLWHCSYESRQKTNAVGSCLSIARTLSITRAGPSGSIS